MLNCANKTILSRIVAVVIISALSVLPSFPSFARVATDSNWDTATSSNWYFEPFDVQSFMSAYSSSRATVPTNTISFTGARAQLQYYNMSNVLVSSEAVAVGSDGHIAIPRPSDYSKPYKLSIRLYQPSLPSPGTYDFTVFYGSNTGIYYNGKAEIYSRRNLTNATNQTSYSSYLADFNYVNNGDAVASATVQIGSGVYFLEMMFYLDTTKTLSFTMSGDIRVNFTRTTSAPDYTTAGGPQTSEDVQQGIANDTAQLVQSSNVIADTLKEIVQHISDQLAALWDQMYNYMHVPQINNDNARTQRIIDRLDEGFDINVETIEQEFHSQTSTLTNGYDNSSFNSANNRLDASIQQYDKAETDIFDSVKGNITGFTIPDFTSNVQVLSAISFSSSWLQKLFDALGLFNLPITVSLVMIFVLMLLGYYRVRSR